MKENWSVKEEEGRECVSRWSAPGYNGLSSYLLLEQRHDAFSKLIGCRLEIPFVRIEIYMRHENCHESARFCATLKEAHKPTLTLTHVFFMRSVNRRVTKLQLNQVLRCGVREPLVTRLLLRLTYGFTNRRFDAAHPGNFSRATGTDSDFQGWLSLLHLLLLL